MTVRKQVTMFSHAMEFKLRLKDHKGGWSDIPLEKLFDLLLGEVQELKEAVAEGNTFEIMAEAADVGNYAMMIVDNAIREINNGTDPRENRPQQNPAEGKAPRFGALDFSAGGYEVPFCDCDFRFGRPEHHPDCPCGRSAGG